MNLIKQILFFLQLLILQLSNASSFVCAYSYEIYGNDNISISEKAIPYFLELNFYENNIFEPSFYHIVSCPSVSCFASYANLVEAWKVIENNPILRKKTGEFKENRQMAGERD